jgi:hypothetical protein
MVGLALGLGTTGYLMATGPESDALKDVHELMANAFLAVVLLHVGGVIAHVLRHRDRLHDSMVTGRKQALVAQAVDARAPVRNRSAAGVGFVVLTAVFMGYLLQHYDAQARTLDLFGTTLQMGENEHESEDHRSGDLGGDERELD